MIEYTFSEAAHAEPVMRRTEPTVTPFSGVRFPESPVVLAPGEVPMDLILDGDGAPVTPEDAVAAIEAGDALLADPAHASEQIVRVSVEGHLDATDRARLFAVTGADARARRRAQRERALKLAEIEDGDDVFGDLLAKPTLSAAEVASIFDVDPKTVHRWAARRNFPAPVRVAGTVRWRTAPILRLLGATS